MPKRFILFYKVLLLAALSAFLHPAFSFDTDRLLAAITQRFGTGASQPYQDWTKLLADIKNVSTPDKLKRVNEFFNRRIQFADDQQTWGQSEYWATPMETLGKGAGDCEDFTIAKYFTLLGAGIPNEQLRLIYVKARIGGANSAVMQAHMVLAFYSTPDAEPVVLDNLITDIRPAGRRTDLQPVFSFNSQGLWAGAGNGAQAQDGTGRLSRWQDLLQRAKKEGFD